MNSLHLVAAIQQAVLDGHTSPGEIQKQVRDTHGQAMLDILPERTKRDDISEQIASRIGALSPLARRSAQLDTYELALRGDVLDALDDHAASLVTPGSIRELQKLYDAVAMSRGPDELRDALAVLAAAGIDTSHMTTELDSLYPPEVA